ncbi:hypothetical protein J2S74_000155 [Evansella vedderi]|uniref:Uncharacterized protein n=1 Tax=Evansella vedderi TaxID=38282 RepID=A0ABT9ZNH2_9BACI|nr:hypothetical protein [Evansella vedderi]
MKAWVSGDGAFDIPYRSLVPQKVKNLLVTGRCISTSHEALATTRLRQVPWQLGKRLVQQYPLLLTQMLLL